MGEVEKSAEAEAEKKGITGKARRDYIGGAFHRIMAHHAGKVKEQKEKRAEHTAALQRRDTENDKKASQAITAERARLEHERTRPRTAEEEKRKRENDAIQAVKDAEARDKKRTKELERAKAYRIKHNISLTTGKKREPAPAAKTKTQLEYEKFLASKEKSMEEARLYREDQDRLRALAKAREDAQEQSRQEDIARRKQLEALESQGYRPFGNWAIFRSGGGYEAISRDMNQHLTKDGKRVHFSTQRQLENYILKHGG